MNSEDTVHTSQPQPRRSPRLAGAAAQLLSEQGAALALS